MTDRCSVDAQHGARPAVCFASSKLCTLPQSPKQFNSSTASWSLSHRKSDSFGRATGYSTNLPSTISLLQLWKKPNFPTGYHGPCHDKAPLSDLQRSQRRLPRRSRASTPRRESAQWLPQNLDLKRHRLEKTYGANYNAAAHLRRVHFNPCQTPKGGRGKVSQNRGGIGGGNHPPTGTAAGQFGMRTTTLVHNMAAHLLPWY
jgi:hypothetical protein